MKRPKRPVRITRLRPQSGHSSYFLDRFLYTVHLGFSFFHAYLEVTIQAVQEFCPGLSAFLDIIQFLFHVGCKTGINNIREVLVHDLVNRSTQPGWYKTTLLLVNIATI